MKHTPYLISLGLMVIAASLPARAAATDAPKPKPVDTIAQTPLRPGSGCRTAA